MAADREAQPDVDRGVAVGRRPPLADAGQQRALGRGRRARPRVVEREERRRPAERRRHRVLEEPVRLGVGRDARVRVDVDHAREDEQPGRVDHLVGTGREPARSGSIAAIRPPRSRRRPSASRRRSRPSRRERPDQSRRRSRPSASDASPRPSSPPPRRRPRHRHRRHAAARRASLHRMPVGSAGRRSPSAIRPASPRRIQDDHDDDDEPHDSDRDQLDPCVSPPVRGSRWPGRLPRGSAGPSRGAGPPSRRPATTVAKWLAASWPTFDAVVQPPYGKKISHSLMPPG